MLKKLILTFSLMSGISYSNALIINEIMSNPVGDDNGREWVELYNNSSETIDLSSLTISIKGGTPIVVTPVSGGTTLAPLGYAIIGSVVSGATKFALDYPSFTGPLLRSSISLVNTGITSIDVRVTGVVVSNIQSYTAAKEGSTYNFVSGSYVTGSPTPGAENQSITTTTTSDTESVASTTPTGSQVTIPQMSPPSADIVLYLPTEKMVVAGAPAEFKVTALTRSGKPIDNMTYTWAYGDGGSRTGSSTQYRYLYPGKYIAQVEGTNMYVAGTGRMTVRVVAPDLMLSDVKFGKYGPYVALLNPNSYDLDISHWKLSIDGALYSFPANTLLGVGETKFTGQAMGFASTTISTSTIVKLLFPTMDEVVRVSQQYREEVNSIQGLAVDAKKLPPVVVNVLPKNLPKKVESPKATSTTTIITPQTTKDTRIATFLRSFFK